MKQKKISSDISSVTVFSDRAQVTRSTKLELSAGEHQILFSDLPQEIEQNSIQVNGTGNAILSDVKFQSEHFTEEPRKDKQQLLKERQDLEEPTSVYKRQNWRG